LRGFGPSTQDGPEDFVLKPPEGKNEFTSWYLSVSVIGKEVALALATRVEETKNYAVRVHGSWGAFYADEL
jgi:hypothetical protein